jgi:hypothetical protein
MQQNKQRQTHRQSSYNLYRHAVARLCCRRLWRLRQGLRDPRYVDAAAREAFGPPSEGREEHVLQFLFATRFLEDLARAGVDLGPTLAPPTGMAATFHRVMDRVLGRPSDSYRSEVETGSFA